MGTDFFEAMFTLKYYFSECSLDIPQKYKETELEAIVCNTIEALRRCLWAQHFNDRPDCKELSQLMDQCIVSRDVVIQWFNHYSSQLSVSVCEQFFIKFLANKLGISDIEISSVKTAVQPIDEQMETDFILTLLSSSQPKRKRFKLCT